MDIKDLIIVGAGPGGVTAAIYAKRSNIDFMIFEKSCVGGNVVNAYEIENYPGVGKILGSDLAMNFMNELDALNINVTYDEIIDIDKNDDIFIVKTSNNETYYSKKILLSLGTKPRKLNIEHEDEFIGRGISFCATCDGAFYKDKNVLVVGGGNSALTEAMYLANISKNVYLITRHNLKGDQKEIDKIKSFKNIHVLEYKQIKKLITNNNLKGVTLIDTNNNETSDLFIDGIFIYIGQIPPTDIVKKFNVTDARGFIKVNEHFETSIKGLFAIGDCIEKEVRQIVTATGDAAIAIHFINE